MATNPPELILSRYSTPEVDCPSEEQTIRLAFQGRPEVRKISVDFEKREVSIVHTAEIQGERELRSIIPFRATHLESTPVRNSDDEAGSGNSQGERRALMWLLGLNFLMFVVEVGAGLIAQSSGLVADGLDMLADSLVYLLSLVSIGLGIRGRMRATRLSAFFQASLGVLTLLQAGWRFVHGSEPESTWMMGVSVAALAVNVACLLLISRYRTGRMHMQASFIFSANDVIANLSVISAGALVAWTGSRYPDLIVGLGICVLVIRGSIKIHRLTLTPREALADQD